MINASDAVESAIRALDSAGQLYRPYNLESAELRCDDSAFYVYLPIEPDDDGRPGVFVPRSGGEVRLLAPVPGTSDWNLIANMKPMNLN